MPASCGSNRPFLFKSNRLSTVAVQVITGSTPTPILRFVRAPPIVRIRATDSVTGAACFLNELIRRSLEQPSSRVPLAQFQPAQASIAVVVHLERVEMGPLGSSCLGAINEAVIVPVGTSQGAIGLVQVFLGIGVLDFSQSEFGNDRLIGIGTESHHNRIGLGPD